MSFIEDLEEIEKELVDWAYDTINEIVDVLSEGGRPFGQKPQTTIEQLEEYETLQAKPEAWAKWITDQTTFFIQKLKDSGLDDKQIASVHPWDVIIRMAVQYSYDMEKKYAIPS